MEDIHSTLDPVEKVTATPSRRRRALKIFLVILAALFLLAGVSLIGAYFWIGRPTLNLYQEGLTTYQHLKDLKDAVKSQDIVRTKEVLGKTYQQLEKVDKGVEQFSFLARVPVAKDYHRDALSLISAGKHALEVGQIAVSAVEPYADILGLKGQGSFTGGTTEDRIVKAVETLDKVVPEIDRIAEKMDLIKSDLEKIDPQRYPEKLRGRPIRSELIKAKELFFLVDNFLSEARPLAKKLPYLLGSKGESKYLLLFQNDKELRPTGGFLTAYAIFRVEKGKIHLESSDDIYKLDETITRRVPPPEPIQRILNEHVWYIRNANFSPDFAASMKTFEEIYAFSNDKKKIDGIIALDTHVLLKIMDTIGPVSAYGTNFTTTIVPQCNCPMIIYELEKYADEPKAYERGSRKDIIGVLLVEIKKKMLTAPKQLLEKLLPVVWQEVQEKHILAYLKDSDAQQGVEALGAAGRLKSFALDRDSLHVNDANLGGAKSNLYIKPKVTLTVDSKTATNNLVLEYQYPHPPDNCSLERKEGLCLAGIYRDYVRIYLPKGSTLISATGFESKNAVFDDLDHTVIDGFFTVIPLGVKSVQIKYTTLVVPRGPYRLVLQKQPGTDNNHYKITVDGKTKDLDLVTDLELVF